MTISSIISIMIFTQAQSYEFNPPLLKVHYFAATYDNSVTFIALKSTGIDQLLHYNEKSELIYNINFEDFVDTICMINDREIICLRAEKNQIWHINLQKKQFVKYRHEFEFKLSCQAFIENFSDSQLLCVREHGDNENPWINLTYYPFPFIADGEYLHNAEVQEEPDINDVVKHEEYYVTLPKIYTELKKCRCWSPACITRKIGSSSKYIWNEAKHKDQIVVYQAEIKNGEVNVSVLKVNMKPLYECYNMASMEAAILEVWEFRQGELLLYTATNKNEKTAISPTLKVVNNTFIWNLHTNIIRECYFAFDSKYHDLQIDLVGTPEFSMFRTFYFESNKVLDSPTYFVRNEDEKIIDTELWQCSHLQKYSVPEYLKDTIVEASYPNGEVKKVNLRTIKMAVKAEMSMFLLLNSNGGNGSMEDWDFDLLSEIIDCLHYE